MARQAPCFQSSGFRRGGRGPQGLCRAPLCAPRRMYHGSGLSVLYRS